jgi:hypothetical protein
MRHGRKSRSHLIDGYKRHVLCDLDSGLVCAVGVTAANLPEAHGAIQIRDDLAAQRLTLAELFIDRAYLSSVLVQDRSDDLQVFGKAWRVHNGPRFAKTDFHLDFDHGLLVCPAGQQLPFVPGGKVQFPAQTCAACPLRAQCTTSTRGRSVQIHPTNTCWPSCASASSPPTGGPSCASGSRSSTAWPTSATGRAAAPATSARTRTCSTCAAAPSSTTCTSSPAHHGPPSRRPEHHH